MNPKPLSLSCLRGISPEYFILFIAVAFYDPSKVKQAKHDNEQKHKCKYEKQDY